MKKIVLLAAMALLLSPLCASAATTGTANVTLTIPAILSITLNAAALTVTPADATLTELTSGKMTDITGGTITVSTNKTWSLNVKAGGANFGGTGNAKAVSALKVKIDSGSYIALNGTTDVVLLATPQVKEVAGAHTVLYEFGCDLTDTSGTYTATLTYTIAN